MPSANYWNIGTPVIWRDIAGTGGNYAVTISGLAANVARVGPVHNFGAPPKPLLLRWYLETQWAGAPTVGRALELYFAGWDDPVTPGAQMGNLGAVDAAPPNIIARLNSVWIGRAVCESGTPNVIKVGGTVEFPYQHLSPLFFNDNITALAAFAIAPTLLRVTPIWIEGQ